MAAPHLAALAALEGAIARAVRAVRAAVPAVDRGPFGCDPVNLTTARLLIDECEVLLAVIADHRDHLPGEPHCQPEQLDWHF